jgi:hypothetical protein
VTKQVFLSLSYSKLISCQCFSHYIVVQICSNVTPILMPELSITCSVFPSLSHLSSFKLPSDPKFTPFCLLLGTHRPRPHLPSDCALFLTWRHLRFSGNRLGIWKLKDSLQSEDSSGRQKTELRRSGHDANRPTSADSTATDHEGALEIDKTKEPAHNHHDFPAQMNILEDAFKNRFA